ncbi:hypothetical protein [Endozoicomonas sp. ONNA1]|uniref:hypothetical protein n=1 Tax=Endozoicomonas sp. ONNA1 TaxID=2828740 RepID=UPI0021487C04|nr:hypothetical protein [Endozoicomonas sp. ONNA1]
MELMLDNYFRIVHGGETLLFEVGTYKQIKSMETEGFISINRYLSTLPIKSQNLIFEQYVKAFENIDNVDLLEYNMDDYIGRITQCVTRLYQLINFDHLRNWCVFEGNFQYPDDLQEVCTDASRRHTTYLRSDYTGLLWLATLLRLALPIWGGFNNTIRRHVHNKRKEQFAIFLIKDTPIETTPEYEKLYTLIKGHTETALAAPGSVLAGLATVEIPEWIMSQIVVRKLPTVDTLSKSSVIGQIYQTIRNTTKEAKQGGSFEGGNVRLRVEPDERNTGEDDNPSTLEVLRAKQKIADKTLVIIEKYCSSVSDICRSMDSSFPVEKYKNAYQIDLQEKLSRLTIRPFHLKICGLMIGNIFPANALFMVEDKATLIRTIIAAQAVLKHWGFIDLAHVLTARYGIPEHDVLGSMGHGQLDTETLELLNTIYPHWQSTGKTDRRGRNDNVGIRFANELAHELYGFDWRYSSPAYIYAPDKPTNSRVMTLPRDLRKQILKLVIKTQL